MSNLLSHLTGPYLVYSVSQKIQNNSQGTDLILVLSPSQTLDLSVLEAVMDGRHAFYS